MSKGMGFGLVANNWPNYLDRHTAILDHNMMQLAIWKKKLKAFCGPLTASDTMESLGVSPEDIPFLVEIVKGRPAWAIAIIDGHE
jgi:hypothetical protein